MNTNCDNLVDMELVDVLSGAIEVHILKISGEATDFEIQLAIKNVLSKKRE